MPIATSRLTRRTFIAALPSPLLIGRALAAEPKLPELALYGPPASPSIPLAYMVSTGALAGETEKATFQPFKSPEELQAGLVSGQWQVAMAPAYTCANLYNKGLRLKVSNIVFARNTTWVITPDPNIGTLRDLKGKSIATFFKNGLTDNFFRFLARKSGLDPDADLQMVYAANPMEAAQILMAGKADAAIIGEPATTAVLLKSGESGRQVGRAINLHQVWSEVAGGDGSLAMGCLLISEDLIRRRSSLPRVLIDGYARAERWSREQPGEAARLAAPFMKMKEDILSGSLRFTDMRVTTPHEGRADLERMFDMLIATAPGLIGGRKPDDAFYVGP